MKIGQTTGVMHICPYIAPALTVMQAYFSPSALASSLTRRRRETA